MARPKGSKTKSSLAKRVQLGHMGITYDIDTRAIMPQITSYLNFAQGNIIETFSDLIAAWHKKFLSPRNIHKAIRGATYTRSGNLASGWKIEGARWSGKTKATASVKRGDQKIVAIFRATNPDPRKHLIGATLEAGRKEGGAIKAKYYFVPLTSWMKEKGRRYTTSRMIREDLSETYKNTKGKTVKRWFMKPLTADTDGPKIVLRYNNLRKGKGRYIKGGKGKREPVSKGGMTRVRGRLQDVTTAMYMAYNAYRGVYGSGNEPRKRSRMLNMPLAAQFGLTSISTAPRWFSRLAARKLLILYNLIMTTDYREEARGEKEMGGGDIYARGGRTSYDPNIGIMQNKEVADKLAGDILDEYETRMDSINTEGSD